MARRVLVPLILVLALVPQAGLSHEERPTASPARPGHVPSLRRVPTEVIDVCKTEECRFHHIQAAVSAAHDGALIRIWPGTYHEEPSRRVPNPEERGGAKPDLPNGTFSYQYHVKHPNALNLIAIVGKHNLTLRGMGRSPHDVVIDDEFRKHVGIRGDRANGLILQNFSFWHAVDHGVYILDTDGFIIDHVFSGYSGEYPFLTFANDHGLMRYCEAVGGGDGGIYPGGSADTPGRVSNEVDHCRSHHNVLGYSGTQGDHNWVHDSEFYDNAVGFVTDSETDHPNYPQNNLIFERNKVHNNNFNVYSSKSDVRAVDFEEGAGYIGGGALIPVGVGVMIASGNDNLLQNNDIWGNSRYGLWLFSGQGLVVGPTSDPMAPPFASTNNRFIGNRLSPPFGVRGTLNKVDFGWDGAGLDNCWQDNFVRFPRRSTRPATSDAVFLPPCTSPLDSGPMPATAAAPTPSNVIAQVGLTYIQDKPACVVFGLQPCVWGPGPAPSRALNRAHGYKRPPDPRPCGPSTCNRRPD
jgi:parallel beta helix pectate lyase-like protein